MKLFRLSKALLNSCLFSACVFTLSNIGFASTSQIYAQLSSFTTQIPGTNQTIAKMEHIDALSGLEVASHNKIIVKEAGTYFIKVTGQAGSEGLDLYGNVNMQLMLNGNGIPCTESCQSIDIASSIYNVNTQAVLTLKCGDTISVGIYSTTPSCGFISMKKSIHSLECPSLNLSMFKI